MPDIVDESRPSSTLSKVFRLSWRSWADLFRAALALGRARLQLPYLSAAQLQQSHSVQKNTGQRNSPAPLVADRIARVSWAIPRAARIVPWRSDCLVQARAAKNWFEKHGIQSEIQLGARKLPDGRMDAHAWLICEGEIVTGGDITSFIPFR